MNCSQSDWKSLSKQSNYCTIHKCLFRSIDPCPLKLKVELSPNEMMVSTDDARNPNVSNGTMENKKSSLVSEQGVEQGVTLTNKENPNLKYDKSLSDDVLSASKVSHAFRFVVQVPSSDVWKKRKSICESKGLNVQLKAGIGNVYMCQFQGFKIWLSDKSITIYFPNWKKYYVEQARFGFNYALEDLKCFLNDLGSFIGTDLSFEGIYKFKTSGQHHALIHNSLAKMYNRNKEKLNVYDKNGELWLVIDNSRRESIRMDDIETIGKTSDRNMDDVVDPFFNQLKETNLMPKDILNMFKLNNEQMNVLIKDREYYAENLKSHVQAINVLSQKVSELNLHSSKATINEDRSEENSVLDTSFSIPPTFSKYDVEHKTKEYRLWKAQQFLKEFGWSVGKW